MILKGSQRAGGKALAQHLMNVVDNEHVNVHEMRGFISDTLEGAFNEIYAISRGTRCKQYLFSLILSPPENENVSIAVFEQARDRIEKELGLEGQSRALVFHEKNGRRHAHCVWSRIDGDQMKSINLSFYKKTLNKIAHDLFIQHGWEMPRGFKNRDERDPLNYTQAEYQQAKRSEQDVQQLKKAFQDCWSASDSKKSFANALLEHGLVLAKGDRRGFVAVDCHGEIYSISRWVGVKAKDVRTRFKNGDDLPTVDEAKHSFSEQLTSKADKALQELKTAFEKQQATLEAKRNILVSSHRHARGELSENHEGRQIKETKLRAKRMPKGLKAAWLRFSGRYETIQKVHSEELRLSLSRDQSEFQKLIESQLKERQELENEFRELRRNHAIAVSKLHKDMGQSLGIPDDSLLDENALTDDPTQTLVLLDKSQTVFTKDQVRERPERILEIITDKEEFFSRNDIIRGLANYYDDPLELRTAVDKILTSKHLIKVDKDKKLKYTSLEMLDLNSSMIALAQTMAAKECFGVSSRNVRMAIHSQNVELKWKVGAPLSDEQTKAIKHVLDNKQLSNVIGLAGSGKSTMLNAAHDGWVSQGYRVRGAALSGKAADSLQEASGIQSRTLASLEFSWKKGYDQLNPNDVLVIDEAGMIGTKQLKRFMDETNRCGAKLVLVGDPQQLQPINAGTPFQSIANNIDHVNLTEVRRQSDAWQRQATLDFAQNRTDEAIKAYSARGNVDTSPNAKEAISRLVQDYMIELELNGDRSSRLAFAHRRRDVHSINQGIRMARKSGGELDGEIHFKTDHGKRAFASGDRILFTKNDTKLGVRNGLQATVENVTNNQITVRFDREVKGQPPTLTFSPKRYASIDHGYATTIHKSQGATVDNAFVLVSKRLDSHLVYVAMSRHRNSAKLYMDKSSMPLFGEKSIVSRNQSRTLRYH